MRSISSEDDVVTGPIASSTGEARNECDPDEVSLPDKKSVLDFAHCLSLA